jgi:hypothetical protein
MCPGRFFGKNEMKLSLIGMFKNYNLKLVENTILEPDRTTGGMLAPSIPVFFEYSKK